MKYREVIKLIAKEQGFDSTYTINNLSVKEVFYNDYITNIDKWIKWEDLADKHTIGEAMRIIR